MVAPLAGVRVVEVADYVFVPAAGGLLADWGADVVKIERFDGGDPIRGLQGGPGLAGDRNVLYETANRGKRSIAIDIEQPDGRELLYRFIDDADVFLTSKLPRVRQKLGIDVEEVRGRNPSVIYARGSGTGPRGPGADRGGFDLICYWHQTGASLAAKAPELDRVPFMPGAAFGDLSGAQTLAGAVALGLLRRERTGEASVVDVSLLATGLWAMGTSVAVSALTGQAVEGLGSSSEPPRNPLMGNFKTSDGRWIVVNCLQGFRYWAEACEVFDRPDLADDARFATAELLFANAPAAAALLREAIASRPLDAWLRRLSSFSGQWGVVRKSTEVPDDADVVANRLFVETEASTGAPLRLATSAVQLDEESMPPRRAPSFNEHADELLKQYALDDDAILDLRVRGILA